MTTLSSKFLGHIKEMYANDKDFSIVYHVYEHYAFHIYHGINGFFLKEGKLCILNYSVKELLVR